MLTNTITSEKGAVRYTEGDGSSKDDEETPQSVARPRCLRIRGDPALVTHVAEQ